MVMDQSPHKVAHVIEQNGERVIVDPEASINSVMLWFYLLINIGACFGVPTTYLAKLVGYWAAYLIPTILYLMLPPLLWYLNPRLIKQQAGGSDLGNVFKVLGDCLRHGGITSIGRSGFWNQGKPSVRLAAGSTKHYGYDDNFVDDVRRTFQACGIFAFTPIYYINGSGIGAAANALSASLDTKGLPNDLLDNLNSISIVISKCRPSCHEQASRLLIQACSGAGDESSRLSLPAKARNFMGAYQPHDVWFRSLHRGIIGLRHTPVLRLQDIAVRVQRHDMRRHSP